MPIYIFENELTGEVKEIFFHMEEKKLFNGEDESEIGQWRRVFTVPLASIDTKLDPRDKAAFVRRTEKYKTVGEFQDISREMSDQRASKDGVDSVKQTWLKNYSSERLGKKHPSELPKVVETPHVRIDMSK